MPSTYISNFVKIRNGLYDKFDAKRKSFDFVFEEIILRKALNPIINLEDLGDVPVVTIAFLSVGLDRLLRDQTVEGMYQVQFGIQCRVPPNNTAGEDKLCAFLEQCCLYCADDELVTGEDFNFVKLDPLTDENDLPYRLETMRLAATFEAVATASYKKIVLPI